MTQDKTPTDAELNVIELMKVVMQADEETRVFALRGTTNWAAYIGKAVQKAVLAKWGSPVVAGEPVAVIEFTDGVKEPRIMSWNALPVGQHRVYTTPQPTHAQTGAVPLTDEQIDQAIAELGLNYLADAHATNRAVLRKLCHHAHDIKGGQHGAE